MGGRRGRVTPPWVVWASGAMLAVLSVAYYVAGNVWLGRNTLSVGEYFEFTFLIGFTARGLFDLYFYVQETTESVVGDGWVGESFVDAYIPFVPEAIWVYALGFGALCGLVPLSATDAASAVHLICGGIFLVVVQCVCFYFVPTAIPRSYRLVGRSKKRWPLGAASLKVLDAILMYDSINNACPSGHVSISTYAGVAMYDVLGAAAVILPLAVAASCCLTKQHVFVDTVAGAALGLAVAWVWGVG